MDIQLDDKTIARLSAVAALQKTSLEALAAELLREASKYHAERAEDLARLERMRETGGIPHNDMMDWLDELATGKDV